MAAPRAGGPNGKGGRMKRDKNEERRLGHGTLEVAETIDGAPPADAAMGDVAHGGGDVGMTEQELDVSGRLPAVQERRRDGMPQGLWAEAAPADELARRRDRTRDVAGIPRRARVGAPKAPARPRTTAEAYDKAVGF